MKLTDKEKYSEIEENIINTARVRKVFPQLFSNVVVPVIPIQEPVRNKICIEIFV